jgi:hypothetical protein
LRIGIVGQAGEPHCLAVAAALEAMGAPSLLIDASTFDADRRFGIEETTLTYNGEALDDIGAVYLRSILSPVPEVHVENDRYKFYDDWHQSYMQNREKHGFLLAWLLGLMAAGKPVVNPPHLGTVSLLKPYQMLKLKQLGFPTPRTVVTNDPDVARAFVASVAGAIAKPTLGGAFCERVTDATLARLDLIRQSPVIFQEEVPGPDIRVTAVAGQILSAVEVESDQVDFRATDAYARNEQRLTSVTLSAAASEMCLAAIDACDLGFTAIDLKRTGPDQYVILELNFSPAFLWIESRVGHPITAGLAQFLVACAAGDQEPPAGSVAADLVTTEDAEAGEGGSPRPEMFFDYGVPRPSEFSGQPQ